MNLSSFSLAVANMVNKSLSGQLGRVIDNVTPGTAHAVGISSGLTGLALWSEVAKHLTAFVGLLTTVVALAGGVFYAIYWAVKALREWRAFKRSSRR